MRGGQGNKPQGRTWTARDLVAALGLDKPLGFRFLSSAILRESLPGRRGVWRDPALQEVRADEESPTLAAHPKGPFSGPCISSAGTRHPTGNIEPAVAHNGHQEALQI